MFEIMYLNPFKNFAYSNVSEQDKLYAVKKAKMKSSNTDFVTWTSRLSPKRKLSTLLNFFFPFIDIRCFFSSLKLQYCWTIVLLNKLKHWTKPLFQKRLQKHRAVSRQEKTTFFNPPSGCLETLPPPLLQRLYGRTDGRTLTSQPKFLSSIGYQVFLPIVLRSAAFGRKGAPLLLLF